MINLSSFEIDYIISEDIPLLDLTSLVLQLEGDASISFIFREDGIVCGTEEVEKIFKKFNLEVLYRKRSGELGSKEEEIFKGKGKAADIHKVWRVSLSLLEYMSGIATNTYNFVSKAKDINPYITVSTTRKNVPFTKKIVTKAIISGGAIPHRVSLSDSILIFKEHLIFTGFENVINNFEVLKRKSGGKTIGIEVQTKEEAFVCIKKEFDFIQLDKWYYDDIKEVVAFRNKTNSKTLIAAAGGININNVQDYVKTGVDIIVTTSLYWGKPLDIKAKIEKI